MTIFFCKCEMNVISNASLICTHLYGKNFSTRLTTVYISFFASCLTFYIFNGLVIKMNNIFETKILLGFEMSIIFRFILALYYSYFVFVFHLLQNFISIIGFCFSSPVHANNSKHFYRQHEFV